MFIRVLDVGSIVLALVLACALRGRQWDAALTMLVLLSLAIFPLCGARWDLYQQSWCLSPLRSELAKLLGCWVTTALFVVLAINLLEPLQGMEASVVGLWFGLAFAGLAAVRAVVRFGWRVRRKRGRNFRRAAIVGATEMGARISHNIDQASWMGIQVIGCFDDRAATDKRIRLGTKVCGSTDQLIRLAHEGSVDVIYVALPMAAELRIKRLMDSLSDTTVSVYFVLDFSTFDLLHARWEMIGEIPVIQAIDTPGLGVNGALKRGFDVVAALAILSLIGLPMLLIAAGVRLTSPGPILFRQQRYGLNGKSFDILKFRSMTATDSRGEFQQASRNDARVTRFGAFLRATSLDELPQFINVLTGQMSLVGPRPHPVAMNEQQRKLIERYMLRHKVKPGITGWAQVNGYRGETDTIEKIRGRIRLDLEYIDNWSFWLDLQILLRTVRVIVHENAY